MLANMLVDKSKVHLLRNGHYGIVWVICHKKTSIKPPFYATVRGMTIFGVVGYSFPQQVNLQIAEVLVAKPPLALSLSMYNHCYVPI